VNLDAVVRFVLDNKVRSRLVWPDVGHIAPFHPVVFAKAVDAKIALVVCGAYIAEGSYAVVADYVRDIVAGQDKFRIVVGGSFPEEAIDLEKISSTDESMLERWRTGSASFDEDDPPVAAMIEEKLNAASPPDDPKPTMHVKFVRWGEFDRDAGGLAPYGVILVSPEKLLRAVGFPGREAAANAWSQRFSSVPEDMLERLPGLVGRTTHISTPETIKAVEWEDAPERALHRFGADYYHETGETLFP